VVNVQGFAKTFSDPQKAARFATTLLFVAAVIGVFLIWAIAGDARSKIPLLILGIVSIVLILTTVEKSYLCGIAIIIIGTVVAQEDFLLKVAHMFRGPPGSVEQYLQTYGDRKAAPLHDDQLKVAVTQQLEEIIGERLPENKKEEITQLLTQARVADAETKLRAKGAVDIPLRRFIEQGSELDSFLKQFEKTDFFLADLTFLRDNGFVRCTRPDEPRTCQGTDLGRRAIEALDASVPLQNTKRGSVDSLDNPAPKEPKAQDKTPPK